MPIIIVLFFRTIYSAPISTEFEKTKAQIEALLKQYNIPYQIIQNNNDMKIIYDTNIFTIHAIHKTGYVSPEPHQEEGPNYDGILLELSVHAGSYSGAADIPQEFNKPYWTTYINSRSVNHAKEYLLFSLSYGNRTNKELIIKIKESFAQESPMEPNIGASKNKILTK